MSIFSLFYEGDPFVTEWEAFLRAKLDSPTYGLSQAEGTLEYAFLHESRGKEIKLSHDDPSLRVTLLWFWNNPAENQDRIYKFLVPLSQINTALAWVLHSASAQLKCQHDWCRPLSRTGIEFPDGRCVCAHCGARKKRGLSVMGHAQVFMAPDGNEDVTRFDWGDAVIGGGEKYLKFSLGSDQPSIASAFFEAYVKKQDGGFLHLYKEDVDVKSAEFEVMGMYKSLKSAQ